MGNSLIEQCTSDEQKIEGFESDMSVVIQYSPPKAEPETIEGLPTRSERVEQTYRTLLS
jgi:hypothetical protein